MADNATLNPATGGILVATDEIGEVHHQRVKIQTGVEGAATDVSASNPVPVDNQLIAIVRGEVPGKRIITKFGANYDVDAAPSTIWEGPTALWVPPTSAVVHHMKSSSVNDAAAGTGAQTVRVWGHDTNFAPISEDLTLNGTTDVPTTLEYIRMPRAQVLTAGSGQVNEGDIDFTATTGGNTVTCRIDAGAGQSLMAVTTIKAGAKAYLTRAFLDMHRLTSASGAMGRAAIMERTGLATSTPVLRTRHVVASAVSGTSARSFDMLPREFVGPCDIEWRVLQLSDNNTSFTAGFDLIEIDD